jgi:hypothetical protein
VGGRLSGNIGEATLMHWLDFFLNNNAATFLEHFAQFVVTSLRAVVVHLIEKQT